jgi:hypothetical protein
LTDAQLVNRLLAFMETDDSLPLSKQQCHLTLFRARCIQSSNPPYGLDDRGWIPRKDKDFFLFVTASTQDMGPTQLPIQLVQRDHSLGINVPGREDNHSPPSCAEVKDAWRYPSTPPYFTQEQCYLYFRRDITSDLCLSRFLITFMCLFCLI